MASCSFQGKFRMLLFTFNIIILLVVVIMKKGIDIPCYQSPDIANNIFQNHNYNSITVPY